MLRIEVLNEDKRHPGIGRQVLEQLGEGLQPPGRGTNPYHGHVAFVPATHRGYPGRLCARRPTWPARRFLALRFAAVPVFSLAGGAFFVFPGAEAFPLFPVPVDPLPRTSPGVGFLGTMIEPPS